MIKIKPANNSGSAMATRLGVAVFLISPTGQFLLSHRASSLGQDTWGLIGGHVEFGEDPVDAICRETKEEIGLGISNPTLMGYSSAIIPGQDQHYVTLFFAARVSDTSDAKNMEPEKITELRWVYHDELPDQLFTPLEKFLDQLGPAGLRQTLAMFPRAA